MLPWVIDGRCLFLPQRTWSRGSRMSERAIKPSTALRLTLQNGLRSVLTRVGKIANFRRTLALTCLVFLQFLSGCGGGTGSTNFVTSPSVSLSPTSPSMGVGANLQFSATLNGNPSTAFNWQVNGSAGGSASTGMINASGLYIAPVPAPSSGTVTVTAVSQADSTQSATTTVTLLPTDPLGTVSSNSQITCPDGGISGSTCYSLEISCPYVADFTTYLKVNTPSGTAIGTVIFGTGTGGMTLYDTTWTYGINVIQSVLASGFTTVQIAFGGPFNNNATPTGWLTGPGGVRRLACRYATAAQWVYQNIHASSTSKPFCATGNSAGGAAITYAVTHYGLDSIFSFIQPTSGPPLARLDYGCIGNGGSLPTPCGQGTKFLTFSPDDAGVVDPAYSTPICSQSAGGNTANQAQLFSDSVDGPGAIYSYPKTAVNIMFGGQDGSVAVPQGLEWFDQVISPNGPPAPVCVADAPHEMPTVLDAAVAIADNVISLCQVQ
jgi:hypothetical protein